MDRFRSLDLNLVSLVLHLHSVIITSSHCPLMKHNHGNRDGTVPEVDMIVVRLLPTVVTVLVVDLVPVLLDQVTDHLLLEHQDLLVHLILTQDQRRTDLNSHNREEILSRLLLSRIQLRLNLVHCQDIRV